MRSSASSVKVLHLSRSVGQQNLSILELVMCMSALVRASVNLQGKFNSLCVLFTSQLQSNCTNEGHYAMHQIHKCQDGLTDASEDVLLLHTESGW